MGKMKAGRVKLLYNARIVYLPIIRRDYFFYLTCFLILLPSGLFFAFSAPYLWVNSSPAVVIISFILLIYIVATFLKCAFTDPGFLPRAQLSAGVLPEASYKDIIINGFSYRLHFCKTCMFMRPPRTSHCARCDNCVERFDHHCPWVSNCIGKRNYKYFFVFVVLLVVYDLFIFALAVSQIVMTLPRERSFPTKKVTAPLILCIYTFIALLPLGYLAGYHVCLIASNMLTYEKISKRVRKKTNPFDKGLIANVKERLLGPHYPSYFKYQFDQAKELESTNEIPQNV